MNKGLYWVATRHYFKSIFFYVSPNYRIEKMSFFVFFSPLMLLCVHDLVVALVFLWMLSIHTYTFSLHVFLDNEFNYFHFKYFIFSIVVFIFWRLKLSFQTLHVHPFSMTPLHKPLTKFYPHLPHATHDI
jgi:hypothetical protein